MFDAKVRTVNDTDLEFKSVLTNVASAIQSRLYNYDEGKDPLERSRLKFLYDIVSLEMEKVDSGLADSYCGLNGPIKAVGDWGEPRDSILMTALQQAELFYNQYYCADDIQTV
jgi:hypothetical protein